MKSLFEIQTESGQLWVDIAAHLAGKDAIIASLQPGYVAPPVSERITAFAALLPENKREAFLALRIEPEVFDAAIESVQAVKVEGLEGTIKTP